MKLYILRHGLSLSTEDAQVATDAERPLSELGRQDIRRVAQKLRDKRASVEMILCSPLTRAQQTAQEAAEVLRPGAGVIVFDPLSNHIPGASLFKAIQESNGKASELLVVGHQPQLGEMVEHLLGKTLDIRPGGIVALELADGGKPNLLWHENP